MRVVFYRLLQWTWGLPQNLAGLILLLLCGGSRSSFYGAVVTEHRLRVVPPGSCFTLGMFIFMGSRVRPADRHRLLVHEYGHTIQSLLLGPLFFPVVFLPSALWHHRFYGTRHSRSLRYSDRWPENNANYWGTRITGAPSIDW